MRLRKTLLVFLAGIALCAPALAAGPQSSEKPIIAVSILPQQYFVQRIAQDHAQVLVLVGPGQDPHSYEPTPRQIADLGNAAVWFSIGVEFEKGLAPKVAGLYPRLQIVDTTKGVKFRSLEAHARDEGDHHDGEAGHDDPPGGRDPHVWLGREAAKIQAVNIRDTLSRIDPKGTGAYSKNCEGLIRDIDFVFESLSKELAPLKGKPVFVYHPSFGYFLDEFGIQQVAVESGGKEPTQKTLASLIQQARTDGARVIFVQPQFSKNAAKTVATAIGGTVVEINALDADWMGNLKRMGDALRSAIR